MKPSRVRLALVLCAVGLTLGGFLIWRHGRAAPSAEAANARRSPLAFVPPGPAFVLSADIAALRRSKLGPLLAERLQGVAGEHSNWSKLCDFEPLRVLDQIALSMPSSAEGDRDANVDFGLVATGDFSAAQIARCAALTIHSRGGDPVTTQIGEFRSVRDRHGAGGEIAARDGGPLILSGGTYFRALLDAANGQGPRLEHQDPRDARHTELRRRLGAGTVLVTWLPGTHWLEHLAGDAARLSPLKNVTAVAFRADLDAPAHFVALLDCTDERAADTIHGLLLALATTLTPALATLARNLVITQDQAHLRLELELSERELVALLSAASPDTGSAVARSPRTPPPSPSATTPTH